MEAQLHYFLLYGLTGAVAGVLAGLLGVGGGVVIVPAIIFIMGAQGLAPDYVMHIALGTSLATIVFTSISSVRAHHKRGAVIWRIVFMIAPGIMVGTYLGSWVASQLSNQFLKGFFAFFLYAVSIQMLLNVKPKPSRSVPGLGGLFGVGNLIGVVSALVGIGGGSLSVPFMVWCNVAVKKAVATSAAIGFPIAVSGAVGYMINGWGTPGLPSPSLGFVFLPALAGVAIVSVLTAPLGARLAHRLPADRLKRIFAGFLLLVATRMFIGLWG